jgi:hypothetical protein
MGVARRLDYSDSVKLLTLLSPAGIGRDGGVDEDRVPYYVFILNQYGNAGFQYAFDCEPALVSTLLDRDLDRLLEAEYITRNSPLRVTADGREYLGRFGPDIGQLGDRYAGVLGDYIGKSVSELLAIAYTLKTREL